MLTLLLIRHADPDYANDTITERGHAQAKSLGEALAAQPIDAIYCSPLGRAQATMRYVAERKSLKSITLDWLRELDGRYGTNAAGENLYAWNQHGVDACAAGPISLDNWTQRVPYAAPLTPQFTAQYRAFDAFLAERGAVREETRYRLDGVRAETVALFCHEGFIKTLLPHLLQIPLPVVYSQMTIQPSSRTTLKLEAKDGFGVFRAVTINDTSHYFDCEQRDRGK